MKKVGLISMLIVLFLLAACDQKDESTMFTEVLPAGQELFRYAGTETADCIAVDENGLLYTATFSMKELSENQGEEALKKYQYLQTFCVYDLNGNCVETKELEISNGTMSYMLAENGMLYCVMPQMVEYDSVLALCKIDTATWEVTTYAYLEEYLRITSLIHIENQFYILGILKNPPVKSPVMNSAMTYYTYAGEAVGRIDLTEEQPELMLLQIEYPIAIAKTKDETIMIYHYNEEQGFGFLKFSPREGTLMEAGWKPRESAERYFTACEDGYIFYSDLYFYFGTWSGTEAQISSEQVRLFDAPIYQKGYLFYQNMRIDGIVERSYIADVIQTNQTIRLLMHDSIVDEPYGCGYSMEKTVLLEEPYALKVLAQDKDFDLYVLCSKKDVAYNLKQNGVFYPLNEVDGVQEYLDACFPYVKEEAINEDGDIWMLPVALEIPGLIYNKEYCKQNNVDYNTMDLLEFFEFTEQEKMENPRTVSAAREMLYGSALSRYLSVYESFDTEVFREYAKCLQCMHQKLPDSWMVELGSMNDMLHGEMPEFYYEHVVHQLYFPDLSRMLGDTETICVAPLPTVEGGNYTGSITFLAVNPQSDNLEVALEYISAFAKYMLQKENSLMLKDKETYTNTPFVMDWYKLYANADIYYDMDADVYERTFIEYLNGEWELEEMIKEIERKREIYIGE